MIHPGPLGRESRAPDHRAQKQQQAAAKCFPIHNSCIFRSCLKSIDLSDLAGDAVKIAESLQILFAADQHDFLKAAVLPVTVEGDSASNVAKWTLRVNGEATTKMRVSLNESNHLTIFPVGMVIIIR